MLKYQVALLEQDDVNLKTTAIVNPATFLSSSTPESVPEHDCLQTINEVYSTRKDLKERNLHADGSSFVRSKIMKTGYAVVTTEAIIEEQAWPSNVSAQKAELIALTRVLELSQGKKVNVWIDSKYAFSVIHTHEAIWKERGLLTSQGSEIKHASQILKLLEAIHLPAQLAAMHCKAHQKGDNDAAVRGNQLADKAAKEAAKAKILALIPEKVPRILDQTPHY